MANFMKPREDAEYVKNALRALDVESYNLSDALDAISKDGDVLNAFNSFLGCTRKEHLENDIYDPLCQLLNSIMLAVAYYAPRSTENVVVFRHPSDTLLQGDTLYSRFKPDIVELEIDLLALRAVTAMKREDRDTYNERAAVLQRVLSGAEIKTATKSKGQIFNYLVNMKLHRPDLATLHGFHLEKGHVILYSLNACEMVASKNLDIGDLKNWIAHVALAYQALAERCTALRPVDQEGFVRWDLTMNLPKPWGPTTIPLAQFQVGTIPGRSTWVAFQVKGGAGDAFEKSLTEAYHTTPPVGFVKVSWQDTKGKFPEGNLLSVAHGFRDPGDVAKFKANDQDKDIDKPGRKEASWIPGLVRHLYYQRYPTPTVGLADREGIQRVRELLWLGSIGQPLSQCESLEHLYKVMFDILGISLHMAERGIIHRDLSWFNMLCKPKHNPETLKRCRKVDHRPCIDYILSKEKSKKVEDFQPCALITDLDHSAIIKTIEEPGYGGRRERTGTAMFIALELSSTQAMTLPKPSAALMSLVTRFETLQNHYPEEFAQAFHDDKGDFLNNFSYVLEMEEKRTSVSWVKREIMIMPKTNPNEPNRLHHDAEGVWWAMMWAMSRASPIDATAKPIMIPTYTANDASLYAIHCDTLLGHVPGDEEFRDTRISHPDRAVARMHPDIQAFAGVLIEMAMYLTIPWHEYVDRGVEKRAVRRDHAHQAMRRLLLLAILELRAAEKTVPFSTAAPRTYTRQPLRDRVSAPEVNGHQGSGISQQLSAVSPVVLPQSSTHKRSYNEAFDADVDVGEAREFEQNSGNDGDDPKDKDYSDTSKNKSAKVTQYKDGYEVPVRPLQGSTFDWIDKFHIDTLKWFGTGH